VATVSIAGTRKKYRGLVTKHQDLVATTKVKGGGSKIRRECRSNVKGVTVFRWDKPLYWKFAHAILG
jgi:hypothetical protein